MSITTSNSLAESKILFLEAKDYFTPRFAVPEQFIYNRCPSADWQTELLPLHQNQLEIVAVKVVYWADWGIYWMGIIAFNNLSVCHPDEGGISIVSQIM